MPHPRPKIANINIMVAGTATPLRINRKRRVRNISLRIADNGEVTATAPRLVPIALIVKFAETKSAWIAKNLAEIGSIYTPQAPAILYRGARTRIRLATSDMPAISNKPPVWHSDGCLWLKPSRTMKTPSILLEAYLRQMAETAIGEILPPVLQQIGEADFGFTLTNNKSRWGSCARTSRHGLAHKRLSFNWRLIMATSHALHYVVVHEVAHLRHPNHSAQFWQLVAKLMPDWQASHRWLRQHQRMLMIDFDRQLAGLTQPSPAGEALAKPARLC